MPPKKSGRLVIGMDKHAQTGIRRTARTARRLMILAIQQHPDKPMANMAMSFLWLIEKHGVDRIEIDAVAAEMLSGWLGALIRVLFDKAGQKDPSWNWCEATVAAHGWRDTAGFIAAVRFLSLLLAPVETELETTPVSLRRGRSA